MLPIGAIVGRVQEGDEVFAWMALSRAPALDIPGLRSAFALLGGIAGLFRASDAERRAAGITPEGSRFLDEWPGSDADALRRAAADRTWSADPRHHLLPFTDSKYPAALRAIAGSPIALYVAGSPEVLNDPQLSIVGSRNPTAAGRDTAFSFAESLAACGLGITSGLAEGIDSAAHRGALAAQGITVAVLGSGLDIVYPRSNLRLSEEILVRGALISEFPLGTPPRRENFPQRNRIIATLSMGTLVIEAAKRSGSLITARLAGDHNRELFAVPGSIHNPLSRGCHELIRQGAKLTETAADILTELNFSHFFEGVRRASDGLEPAPGIDAGMDKEHKILLDALGFDPADLDDADPRARRPRSGRPRGPLLPSR
jgi:DNA processing protein